MYPRLGPRSRPRPLPSFPQKSFAEIAVEVIHPFTGDDITRAELGRMAEEAYATFNTAEVTPLHAVEARADDPGALSWTDAGVQGRRDAAAGAVDGSRAGQARHAGDDCRRDLRRHRRRRDRGVQVFKARRCRDPLPRGPRLRRAAAHDDDAEGKATSTRSPFAARFDDCQALVKGMFNDHAFRDRVELSGVNSINWARIVAQVTYYFYAASRLTGVKAPLSFAVPTGNFGDIFAGYVAKRMGLPIGKLIIASNENDILPRAVETGVYAMKGVVPTTSPSMDIQVSSNFERYLFEASGRDAALVRSLMSSLADNGSFELASLWPALQADFAAVSASEDDVARCIRTTARGNRICGRPAYRLCARRRRTSAAARRNRRPGDGPSSEIPRCHKGDHRQTTPPCRKDLNT